MKRRVDKPTHRQYGNSYQWESIQDSLRNGPVTIINPGKFPLTKKRLENIQKS